MNTIEIGKRMKEIREQRRMGRPAFDKAFGISESSQARYESGEFPDFLDVLLIYHDVGNVSYDFLLDGKKQSLEDAELFSKISRLSIEQKELVKEFISLIMLKK